MNPDDLENGLGEGTRRPDSSTIPFDLKEHDEKDHLQSELEIFQTLVGIYFLTGGGGPNPDRAKQTRPANPLLDIFLPTKASKSRFRNRGLYDRALSQDLKNRSMYTISHYIIAGLYLLQIVIAASLTALSASHGSTVTLTGLGATNTVIAGILAWLTGQGMPVRFRQARDQYREVVKAIEKAERTFAEIDYIDWLPGQRPHPITERNRLEKLYDSARLDEEANYPEKLQTPSASQQSQQNEELKDKVGKSKTLKREHRNEIEALQKELDTVRQSMRASFNSTK